jgi:hypothetical protein
LAVQEVFDAVITNARSVLTKIEEERKLALPQEKVLARTAKKILDHQDHIQDFFLIRKKSSVPPQ